MPHAPSAHLRRLLAGLAGACLPVASALALDDPAACEGAACGDGTRLGAWGLIALGLTFFLIGLMPARLRDSEEEQTGWNRMPLFRMLQRRIEKELTGWRRVQWPVLGVFFVGVGVAFLAGWR